MLALRNDSRLSGRPPGTGEKRMLVDRSDPTRREPLARGTAKSCREWHLARHERRGRQASTARVPCAESSLSLATGDGTRHAPCPHCGAPGSDARLRLRLSCA